MLKEQHSLLFLNINKMCNKIIIKTFKYNFHLKYGLIYVKM